MALFGPPAIDKATASFTVSTAADIIDASDGKLSLREAINHANASSHGATIGFAKELEGARLVLTGGQLTVTGDLRIGGPRSDDGSRITIDGNGMDRVLHISGRHAEVEIRDLVIANGLSGYADDGGGILVEAGNNLSLERCVVQNNHVGIYGAGGGIAAAGNNSVIISNSSIIDNFGEDAGGAIILFEGSSLVMRQSSMENNGSSYGRALFLLDADAHISETVIARNGAMEGGAIWMSRGTAMITRSTITENEAVKGGGIDLSQSELFLSNSTLAGNIASDHPASAYTARGGGINASTGHIHISGSTLTGNRSEGYEGEASGGGISLTYKSDLDISNSLVVGNFVKAGSSSGGPIPTLLAK